MALAIVINTTDKYCDLWDSWHYYFKKWKHNYPVYFLNENLDVPYDVKQIKVDVPEVGMWTKKLRESLSMIPEGDVLVKLEDHWITDPFKKGEFDEIYRMFRVLHADSMRIREWSMLTDTGPIVDDLRFLRPDSKYLISHDPCIWRRSFLIKCLNVDESPWENEINGTERIRGGGHNIFHYDRKWWTNAMVKGVLTPEGQKMKI